ncbi:MAG: branched-chain amino acid transport system II carrier protein [Lachnospiraceae bacterium]|nr:branched-chain amino acid transport system II carrier protein [Lachnospiraceae bacterium]
MKKKLSVMQLASLSVMLFGMFFGAGNLIFPVFMGQMAGQNILPAIVGFILSGVALPMLGVVALGRSRCEGLHELSCRVGKPYAFFFTCLLYLTIGPFFSIPRCASTSFSAGVPLLFPGVNVSLLTLVFTLIFFGAALSIALRPRNILTYIGKVLTPAFLVSLGVILVVSIIIPMGSAMDVPATGNYVDNAFVTGVLEGYNTMDALASLAFGIVVVNVIRGLGIKDSESIAVNTMKAGVFSCLIMAVIYALVTLMGARSMGAIPMATNGSEALGAISAHYFGNFGTLILVIIVTLACFKTATGLIISCAQAFVNMFPKGPSYKAWAIGFTAWSFVIANFGLNTIIKWSVPVLMFLYPLAITLILLSVFGKAFNYSKIVYVCTTACAFATALLDLINALPAEVAVPLNVSAITEVAAKYLPLYSVGMGWIVPSIVGFVVGLIIYKIRKH